MASRRSHLAGETVPLGESGPDESVVQNTPSLLITAGPWLSILPTALAGNTLAP